MKRIIFGFILILALSSAAFAQEEKKKALGRDLVPAGTPYSPGVLIGDALYISGLQGTGPRTHELPKDFEQEVKNCLDNIGRVLKDAGMDYSNVVSVQIFLVDMSQFQTVNSIYKQYFKMPYPSRTAVGVAKLSLGASVEIAVIAHR